MFLKASCNHHPKYELLPAASFSVEVLQICHQIFHQLSLTQQEMQLVLESLRQSIKLINIWAEASCSLTPSPPKSAKIALLLTYEF